MPANATKILRNVCWYVLWYWVSSANLIIHCARRSTRTSMQRVCCGWHDLLYDSPKHNNICCANATNHSSDYIIAPPQIFFGENLFLTAVYFRWIALKHWSEKDTQRIDNSIHGVALTTLAAYCSFYGWWEPQTPIHGICWHHWQLCQPEAPSPLTSVTRDLVHVLFVLGFLPTHTSHTRKNDLRSVSRPVLIGGRNGVNTIK